MQDLLAERVHTACTTAREKLLAERNARGFWEGELSTSALSTATAVMALEMVRRGVVDRSAVRSVRLSEGSSVRPEPTPDGLPDLIAGGLRWLAEHQNADGGWGDTTKSFSNISTTMLCHAVFHATAMVEKYTSIIGAAKDYIDRAGGVAAVRARYGKDKTFSIPILTHCALAGLVRWDDVSPLPFELACIPARFYKTVRLPVVSYALPALIAIGQARHHFRPPRNPVTRLIRNVSVGRSLNVLERIQPPNGGFLEATPLTSFVTMSLAAIGLIDHPVTRRGAEFIARSVRPDGSWPIDTNLATWVTTLSINALGTNLPRDALTTLHEWLIGQQYREAHPYTNADAGGWAWTDLPGGVPDADDTPGAMLALKELFENEFADPNIGTWHITSADPCFKPLDSAASLASRWLLDLQNRDGGWPTFCRGWGTLPFDRSAPDLTAHVLRALWRWAKLPNASTTEDPLGPFLLSEQVQAMLRGFRFLERHQRSDGSWLPLWFGNQHVPNDENPTYGTARVLAAYRDCGRIAEAAAQRALEWLRKAQNSDGGWGGAHDTPSSIEETALAVEVFVSLESNWASLSEPSRRGLIWLLDHTDNGKLMEPSPIGFYFAKLWYFEKLYPLIFTVAALRRAVEVIER